MPSTSDIGGQNCFTVNVTDKGCPYVGSAYATYCINVVGVEVDAGPDLSVSCGQCTTLTANPVGGVPPYTYTWNPGNSLGSTLTPACVGTYIVDIRDNNGCTNKDTIDVVPSAGSIGAAFNFVTNCSGAPVQFTDLSSGGAISTWAWSFGDGGTSNIQNPSHQYAANGNYNVSLIVSSPGGCVDTLVQQVTVATNVPVAQFASPPVCQGDTTSFTNQSSGGPMATYSWNFGEPASGPLNSASTANPTHAYLSPGTYTTTLIVVNTAGCSDTLQQTVTVNANPTLSIAPQQICNGQTATLTAPAGFNSYAWSNGGNAPTVTVSPAATTNYTLTVTDANSCSNTVNTQVTVNPVPVANAGLDQAICAGTSANLTGSGGSAGSIYTWNPGALADSTVTVTPAATTRYTVQVTSGTGCSSTASVLVTVNPMPSVSADNDAAVCKGTTITINANSGIANYSWQPGGLSGSSITVTPLATTTYTVTVSDAIGCTGSDQITISVNPLPDANFSSNAPQCQGASVTFTDNSSVPTGSIVGWAWDFGNGQTSTSQNTSSSYATSGSFTARLIVTSDGGCKDTVTNSVSITTLPTVDAGLSQDICPGATANLTANGGSQYSWSPGGFATASISVSPTATTDYTVNVTDANGCQGSDVVRVTVQPLPVANAGNDQSICNGTSTSLVASGGDTYIWSPGNSTSSVLSITPSTTTTYTLIATNTFGCRDTDQVEVRVNPLPVASFAQTGPVCQSTPVSFTDQSAVGVGTITAWSWDLGNNIQSTNPNPTLLYTAPGNYTVRLVVTSDEGCRDTVSQPVSIYAEPVANFTSIDVCDGEPVQFTDASSISDATPLSYSWSLGDNTSASSQSFSHTYSTWGSYPVDLVVSSNRNCRDTISHLANVFALPDAAFTHEYACTEDPAVFADASTIPDGAISAWSWNLGDGTTDVNTNPSHAYAVSGYYQIDLLVTSDHGCQDSTNSVIRIVPLPMADFSTTSVCYGFESSLTDISLPVSGSIVSYLWNLGDGQTSADQNVLHIYRAPGFYQVSLTVTTDSGCVNTMVRPSALEVFPPPPVSFQDNAVLASDIYPIVNFTNQTGSLGTYLWSFGDGTTSAEYSPTHEYADIGVYVVQMIATDLNGCVDTLSRTIDIRPTSNVYIPNAFSPNGDRINDVFSVYSYNVVSVKCQIYDRWGLKIYTWDDLKGFWDGTIDGDPVQADVYEYRVVTIDVNNKQEVRVGHVTVVR